MNQSKPDRPGLAARDAMAEAGSAGPWHAIDVDAVLSRLEAGRGGLAGEEAARRLARHGPNALPRAPRRSALARFLAQLRNVLIYVLLGAAVLTLALGHLVDTAVILGVVLVNALIGFFQEGKAEQALDAIGSLLPLQAQVLRDGRRQAIDAAALVPGDIVFVCSGDKPPADLRLLEARNLRIAEAALTGESLPVEKQADAVGAACALGDRASMAYSGTLVSSGQGMGVVVATGAVTELGRISGMLARVATPITPLLEKLARFGTALTWAILALAATLVLGGTLWRGYPLDEMLLAAVGLAVAAIPEGLPAIMTITLAISVRRMAGRNAIIRRLPAAEVLGSVSVICSDKTGTLTKNEMTVQRVIAGGAVYEVGGVGYGPEGGFSADGREADAGACPVLAELARAGLLCNDAQLVHDGRAWQLAGDPTEGALVALAMKAGYDPAFERAAFARIDVIPFESEHRFMTSLHHNHLGRRVLYLKGAPERVLALCALQRGTGADLPFDPEPWSRRMDEAAQAGMRLLALAARPAPQDLDALAFADVETGGFTLLGVVGISDPPREEALRAVAACRGAGIRVTMITGDHVVTAAAIGRQLGLAPKVRAVACAGLDQLDDAALQELAADTEVFARASPEHKLRLVAALQARGEIVAMTGDGVNDAPALKKANIGVAMGNKGTEAAKDAAEIVLADDNFASIVAAVEEGRTVYNNLRKAILFILPTNGGQAGTVLVAVLLGMTLPITPVQILWVNTVTAATLALAIAFERSEPDVMRRPPRSPAEPLLSRYLVWRIVLVSAMLVAGSIGLFLWELAHTANLAQARTAAVNALVMGEVAYLFNCRRIAASSLGVDGFAGNPRVVQAIALLALFQLSFTYLPAAQALFGTAGLDGATWLRIAAFGLAMLLAIELEKWLFRRRGEGAHAWEKTWPAQP